ncbi:MULTISPECIES: cysteine hydrolase family protein [unclassified Streptomyces]|uniref:cysteine hydrolase family protein n=1 Tax=unclassified Streptomyces TaxID=2593676 RepID=UPI0022564A82|nr:MULTISPECIES: isochorismatase family cysteine hydrolase [unclassified Streptomyces]MCX4882726.1 cysteine hydrolase [Streptomyces sp. NBC_00847]MCX5422756.1 cysteine hydrolase [Streptomyces sp. NBC_00078]
MDRSGETTGLALVVIDMINTYDHEDADLLVPSARQVVPVLADLIGRARRADVPVIYANDNFGRWRSHHGELVETALARPHADLIEPIRPDDDSLFVVKARHSVFHETPLSYLLWRLGVGHVVLSGQVTEQCVLYSALDAHIRHLRVTVADDAVATIHPHLGAAALEMMERNMGARIVPAEKIDFSDADEPGNRDGR